MCSAVDEKRRQVVTERRGGIVDGKHGERQVTVPVVLAAVGVRAQRVADDAVGPLHLGVGVLVVGRADDEARAHALDEGAEHLACELGVVVHHERVGIPGAGPQAHFANDHRSIRRRRSRARGDGLSRLTWFWIMSKPAAGLRSSLAQRCSRRSSTSASVVWSACSCCWSSKICWSCAASLKVAVVDPEESVGAEVAAMLSTSV